jgi:hypothetical protein
MSIPARDVEGWLRLTIAVKELRLNYAATAQVKTDDCSAKISLFFKFLDKRWPRISRMNTDQIGAHL